jgi:hypothetical protein
VRPSGDEPNLFSTSGIGRDFKSSFAAGFDPGFDSAALGFDSTDTVGCSVFIFINLFWLLNFRNLARYTLAFGWAPIAPAGKQFGTSRRATPIRLSAKRW